jgi:hypothetical protein
MDGAKHGSCQERRELCAAASANLARNLSIQASYDGVDRGKSYRNHRISAGSASRSDQVRTLTGAVEV